MRKNRARRGSRDSRPGPRAGHDGGAAAIRGAAVRFRDRPQPVRF